MTVKHNSIYLFLALACFVGVILIFIFDGYIGVYDSLVIDNGQYKQTVAADQWAQREQYGNMVSTSVDRNSQVDFTYTVENHRFSDYTDSVDVSLWYNKVKTADLLSTQLSIPSFNTKVMAWSINATQVISANASTGQSYIYNVKIKRGDIERDINVNIYVTSEGIIIVPAPVSQ
jgi:hypothetical protein